MKGSQLSQRFPYVHLHSESPGMDVASRGRLSRVGGLGSNAKSDAFNASECTELTERNRR